MKLQSLNKFMTCYWMQTADLAYGTLDNALKAFIELETERLAWDLLDELMWLKDSGLAQDIIQRNSEAELFWKGRGGRWLSPMEVDALIEILRNSLPGKGSGRAH